MTQELKPGLSPEPCAHRWAENGVYCCKCGDRRIGSDIQKIVTAAIWEARDLFRSRQHDNHELAGALINRTIDTLVAARAEGPAQPSDDGPGRVAFVRETLTRLMEENGGPHCREARIALSGSTIAAWLLRLGGVSAASLRPTPEPQAEVRGLVDALEAAWFNEVEEFLDRYQRARNPPEAPHPNRAMQLICDLRRLRTANSHQGEK